MWMGILAETGIERKKQLEFERIKEVLIGATTLVLN